MLNKVSDFRRKVSADLRKSQKVSVSLTFSLIKLKINYFCAAKSKQTSLTFFSTALKVAGLRRVFGGRVKGEQDVSAPGVQIKELYHGVLMKTSRASAEVVRAYVHVHCADTPEANISCGKMETCSKTLCFCRHCYAKQSQRLMPADTVGFLSAVAGLGTCAYTLRCAHIDAAEHAAVQIGADGSQYGISNSLK